MPEKSNDEISEEQASEEQGSGDDEDPQEEPEGRAEGQVEEEPAEENEQKADQQEEEEEEEKVKPEGRAEGQVEEEDERKAEEQEGDKQEEPEAKKRSEQKPEEEQRRTVWLPPLEYWRSYDVGIRGIVVLVLSLTALIWLILVFGLGFAWKPWENWEPWAWTVGIDLVLVLIGVRVLKGHEGPEWTGFGRYSYEVPEGTEVRPRKTLWDWLQLLIVPIVLAAVGVWFAAQQSDRQQAIENNRASDDALQAYITSMSDLMLKDEFQTLRTANSQNEEVTGQAETIAQLLRARTITVLLRVTPDRKRAVVGFLYETDLSKLPEGDPTTDAVVDLEGANLNHADLSNSSFEGIDLEGANLASANLQAANLAGADLRCSILKEANLRDANLEGADLGESDLEGANLKGTHGISEAEQEMQGRPSDKRHCD
jgi:hypothetical protein